MRKGEATRQKIIEQTSGLFNTKGYYATTLSDVMRQTGLQKGGIYNHFKSKEELSLEVFQYNLACISRQISDELGDSKSCEEKLLAIIKLSLRVAHGNPVAGGCPILNAGVEADGTYEPLEKAARKAISGFKKSISALLREGVASGEFRENLQINELTDFFIACFEGAMFLSKVEDNNRPLQSTISVLESFIVGLRKK